MRPRRFYSDIKPDSGHIEIVSEELSHLRKVLRSKQGDPVEIFNGKGKLFSGKIESIESSKAVIKIDKEIEKEKPPANIMIAPSLLKKKPMNLMIEKLTEMGVDEIHPVIFSRTEASFNKTSMKKWERLAVESLKVNDNLWASRIHPPCTIEEIINRSGNIKNKILLDIEGKRVPIENKGPSICIVGPPGDFTIEEREMFIRSGFIPVNINESVMKVETAAFSAVSILKYLTR